MTFSAKIRWYLLGVAVIPPLFVLAVLVIYVNRQIESAEQKRVVEKLQTYDQYRSAYLSEVRSLIEQTTASPGFTQALGLLSSGRTAEGGVPPIADLNFFEVLDSANVVVASMARPGMIGERLTNLPPVDSTTVITAVEYDRDGAHPSFVVIALLDNRYKVYAGRFISSDFLNTLSSVIHANVVMHVVSDEDSAASLKGMQVGAFQRTRESFQALLEGGASRGFYLVADMPYGGERPAFISVIQTTAWVTVFSTFIALGLGLYLSWQTKREISNLIDATSRVAKGDLSTAVMSFEEGEFATLADAFSSMVTQLKESQGRLAATQTIAAWQTMGRKIAHEVKNPLTPIAICADDLRRSYQENLPNFEQTLDTNTRTIKNEVARLTNLLDEFSRFARMAPPDKVEVELPRFLDSLRELYSAQIGEGKIILTDTTGKRFYHFDPQQIKQVLINCLKNSLEACAESVVTVKIADQGSGLQWTIEDNGPGFSPEQLSHPFEPYFSSKRDGSGLGLVICQRIITDHGGQIELYNLPNRGAGVKFTLPEN